MNLSVTSIASEVYRRTMTDRSFLNIIKAKGINYVELQSDQESDQQSNKNDVNEPGRAVSKRVTYDRRETSKIWEVNKTYPDTSSLYRRMYINVDLWSRIVRNSGGTLPNEIRFVKPSEIAKTDSDAVKSYVTPDRGIRKCCLTVFVRCAKMAATTIGCFEGCEKHPYSCKPIGLSVEKLSKDTHAGTDTLGKKNDPKVKERIKKQARFTFRNPTSYQLFGKNFSTLIDDTMVRLFNLPELIFHRFQAVYDETEGKSIEKSRIVWCVPYLICALEVIFFDPILDAVKRRALKLRKAIYPIGLTNYQVGQKSVGTLREDFRSIYDSGSTDYSIYSIDIKKFDANVPNWFKDIFFVMFGRVIKFVKNQARVYNYLRLYIKHTPFIYKGEIYYKEKGISSGLYITNLIDSLINLTIHFMVQVVKDIFPENLDEIYYEKSDFSTMYFDTSRIKNHFTYADPLVRVMGDDSIICCNEFTLKILFNIGRMLGFVYTIKHVCKHPDDPIFFLGRFWNSSNRPFHKPEYMALRIVYTKWYDKKKIPYSIKKLHLYRMLSICLPLVGGKEFLDKYLFDYPPYKEFMESDEGFTYTKEFIENTFKYVGRDKMFDVDNY